jgi:hypothetical protein
MESAYKLLAVWFKGCISTAPILFHMELHRGLREAKWTLLG